MLRDVQLTLTYGLTTYSSFFSVILGMGYPFWITRPVFLLLLLPLLTVLLAATVAPLSLRGVPLFPFSPLLLLLLLLTSLALRRSELRLPLVGDAATARARGARVVEGAAGEAVEELEEAEGVAVVVGVVPGVGASVAAVEVVEVVEAAAEVVEAAAAVVEAAAAVVLLEVQPRSVEALVVASTSSSRAPVRPRRPRSFFPDVVELPRWHDLLLQNVPIFDLDFDAILAAMYAFADSAEGDCYLSVPPDPGIAAAALGASASAALGAGASALSRTAPTEALHTFTLDSGASRSFFRDSTTLTPLSRPVAVSLADPSGVQVLAHSSTDLLCPTAPSGLLSGLHLPSFPTNLVSGADLQDAWVDQFALGGQRVTHCTCSQTGRHLATFTCRPGSSLYTLTTTPPPVSASGQVAASSQVFAAASRSSPESAPCSCRPLSHDTLLWHHRLGHPSLPRLRGMASRALVSGLPRSLPPLPPGPAPTCVPCVEGWQRTVPHSSTFPPTEAPLQTLHMDVWGPARVRGQGHERYFLLVIDDYSRYTTVFPLRSKGEVSEGIRQTFTLPASPQQNGIAERRIGMVMDVARTSMIHAAAPHFLWPFAVQYAAHQINLQPRRTSRPPVPFPVSSLASPLTHPGGSSTTPPRVLFCPLRTSRLTSTPPVDPLPPQGPTPSGVSRVDPAEPVEVAVDSGAARGAARAGAGTGGAEPGGTERGGAETGCADSGGAACWGAEPACAESGGSPGAPLRREPLSLHRFRECYARCCRRATGATGAGAAGPGGVRTGGTGVAGAGAAGGAADAGAAGGSAGAGAAGGAAGAGAATGTAGAGATGGAAGVDAAGGAASAGATRAAGGGTGAVSAVSGGAARPRP
ncbi:unnamed protein product, partial [Closterium sp. NIES-54]